MLHLGHSVNLETYLEHRSKRAGGSCLAFQHRADLLPQNHHLIFFAQRIESVDEVRNLQGYFLHVLKPFSVETPEFDRSAAIVSPSRLVGRRV